MLRRLYAMIRKELAAAAASPSAWVFLIIFLILSSFCAFVASGMFSSGQADLTPFFDWMPWLFLLIVPALAMPMWSEERRLGVFELTLSFPATLGELVFGKFLAGTVQLAIALLLTFPVPLTAIILGEPDIGAILCGYAGALLLGCVYLAISGFCSAVSKSQTASFLLSLLFCGFFLFAGWQKVTDLLALALPADIVRTIASCGFLTNYQAFQKGVIDTSELVYDITLAAVFLSLTQYTLKFASSATGSLLVPNSFKDPAFRTAAGELVLRTVLVLLTAVCLNLIAGTWKIRVDAGSDKAYSIAPETRALAAELEKPVTLRFYASVSNPAMPQPLRKYAARVEWLLREFAAASHGKIKLVIIDPAQDSPEEEAAVLDGCTPYTDNAGNRMYLGMSAAHGAKTAAEPLLQPSQETQLEYNAARIVLEVIRTEIPKIGIISPFPVAGTHPDMTNQLAVRSMETVQLLPPWYSISEISRDCGIVELPTDVPEIPAELNALLLIHPVELPRQTLFALDQFVLRGGKLAIFLDPRSFYAAIKSRTDYSMLQKLSSSLEPLLSTWGITYQNDLLTADMLTAYRKRLPDRMITNPLVLNLQPDQILRENPVTARLKAISMYYAGTFDITAPAGAEVEKLLTTSKESQIVNATLADRPEGIVRKFKASGNEMILGAVLRGKMMTAFPNGAPDRTLFKDDFVPLKTAVAATEIFIFADSDMLFNDVCITPAQDAFGEKTWVRSNDNVTLLQNVVERITGDSKLMPIRSRIPMSRPLTLVNKLKSEAELEFRNSILKAEKEYVESSRQIEHLRKLAAANPPKDKALEIRTQLRSLTLKNNEARRNLNELRADLKSRLDRLEIWIETINLAVVPGFVALAGILWAALRRRSMKRGRKHL